MSNVRPLDTKALERLRETLRPLYEDTLREPIPDKIASTHRKLP